MRLRIPEFLAVCLLTAAINAFGQADRGTITGIVSDQGGAVIANAAVQAKNSETGQVYQSGTTDTGNYTIAQLPYAPMRSALRSPASRSTSTRTCWFR
jgi:hypothetical protein